MSGYPTRRMRRLRRTPAIRAMRRETHLSADDFIYPLFVVERGDQAGPVSSMPGVSRLRIDDLDREVESILAAGVRSVLLFGLPSSKDAAGSTGCCDDNIVSQAALR
ncbi:MAG: porphobilinogen synthase, partial [Planctomycetota bacterium]